MIIMKHIKILHGMYIKGLFIFNIMGNRKQLNSLLLMQAPIFRKEQTDYLSNYNNNYIVRDHEEAQKRYIYKY